MNAVRRFPAPATLCLCLALLANEARSQDSPPTTAERGAKPADVVLLRERNREALHPGDPLRLVGREQDSNDLRGRTPALAKTDGAVVYVDQDEAYRRKLAMYADRARFTETLPVSPDGPPEGEEGAPAASPAPRKRAAPAPTPEPARSWAPLWIGAAALGLAVLFRVLSPRLAARIEARERATRAEAARGRLASTPTAPEPHAEP
ncbi:MAG: hypothetical protein HZA52_08100 [Planctomycetes bacterium]|nr:hypothetical protein [Planctomycetota bacterium]